MQLKFGLSAIQTNNTSAFCQLQKKFFACINFLEEAVMPAMSVKQPNIFSHMSLNTHWKTSTEIWALQALSSSDCFYIDQASSTVQLKIKEALHILWENPSLN